MLRLIQIDAFTSRPFSGNPAAVMPLDAWLAEATLQAIAAENALPATAFLVPAGGDSDFEIRWFSPTREIPLCGHGTMGAAHALKAHLGWEPDVIRLRSGAGEVAVRCAGDTYTLDFPARPCEPIETPAGLADAFGAAPVETHLGYCLLGVFEREAQVRGLRPDARALAAIDPGIFVATAPGDTCDFVSRCFPVRYGIDEDAATGSSHCVLAPFWAARLGKGRLGARQVSARGAEMTCEYDGGERVAISGRAVTILDGAFAFEP
jgi:PhzF family phenazine biosynthesis protein